MRLFLMRPFTGDDKSSNGTSLAVFPDYIQARAPYNVFSTTVIYPTFARLLGWGFKPFFLSQFEGGLGAIDDTSHHPQKFGPRALFLTKWCNHGSKISALRLTYTSADGLSRWRKSLRTLLCTNGQMRVQNAVRCSLSEGSNGLFRQIGALTAFSDDIISLAWQFLDERRS